MRAFSHSSLRLCRRLFRWFTTMLVLLGVSMASAASHANTFTVTTLNNSGAGSLRQAITDANANAGADTILFASGLTGTIALAGPLPNLRDDVTLTGPGANRLTVARAVGLYWNICRIFTVDNGTGTPPTVRISGLTMYQGVSSTGGGLYSNKANVALTDCAINFNSGSNGGGIHNNQGTMTLTRCTISRNNGISGGGLSNVGGTLTLINCTVCYNYVSVSSNLGEPLGGGIANSGSLNLFGCTFRKNSAYWTNVGLPATPGNGHNLYNFGTGSTTHVTIYQTILSKYPNFGGNNDLTDSGIVINSLGYNMSDDATGPNDGTTDRLNVDARLSELADNGGQTPTCIPLPGSPTLDAGDPNFNGDPATDQRGLPRVFNGRVDIGAVERQTLDLFANNDAYSVRPDHTLRVAASGILANDKGLAPLSAVLVTSAAHGTLLFNADGSFVYTPNAGYGTPNDATDTFTYTAQDGNGNTSNIATVTITIHDNPPVLTSSQFAATLPGQTWNFTATATDSDLPDDALTFSLVNAPSGMTINGATGAITWMSQVEVTAQFNIKVTDRYGKSDQKLFTLFVADLPPVLTNSLTGTATAGQAWNFTATATDPDLPNDALTFALVNAPTDMNINGATGVITWTPQPAGTTTFDIKVTDRLGKSDQKTFTLTVLPDPNAPVANDDAYSVKHDQTLTVAAPGVLANDTGVAALSAVVVTQPAHGSVTFHADGSFVYTPTAGYGVLTGGMDTFTYKVQDAQSRTGNTATVTLTLLADNPPVLTSSLSATTVPGKMWNFTATATDADLPGDALTFSLVNAPSGMTINATSGAITYTPQVESTTKFDIKVTDLYGKTDQKTFTLTVFDNPPTLTNSQTGTATAGQAWNFTATATDLDLPNDALTFSLVNAPTGMSINAVTGAITWTPKVEGVMTFGIKVTDRYGKSDTKTFTLTVQSDPNAPVRLSITDVVVQRASANVVTVSFNVVNSGTGKATNLVITRATLGAWVSVVTSASVTLGAGGRQAYSLTFKGVTSRPGVVYPLQIRGTYQAQNTTQSLFYGGGVVVP